MYSCDGGGGGGGGVLMLLVHSVEQHTNYASSRKEIAKGVELNHTLPLSITRQLDSVRSYEVRRAFNHRLYTPHATDKGASLT